MKGNYELPITNYESHRRRTLVLVALFCCAFWLAGISAHGEEVGASPPDGLLLKVKPAKERVFLREPVSVTVTLLAGQTEIRDVRYPRLKSPGARIAEFGLPVRRRVDRGGVEWSAYDFTATLTPLKSGTLSVGPAELICDALSAAGGSAGFFGGTEARRVTVRSTPLSLTVLPLPEEGRPAGFTGAVGRFTIRRTATPVALRAGDPVTVRTVIRGEGNIEAFSCPSVAGPGMSSYPPHAELSTGALVCEQVLLPESAVVREIPAAGVHFFDPVRGRYAAAITPSIPLAVAAVPVQAAVAQASVPPAPAVSRRSSYALALAAVLIVCGAGGTGLILARRRQTESVPPADSDADPRRLVRPFLAAAETALAAGEVEGFYAALFRGVQAALATKLELPAAGLTLPIPEEGMPPSLSSLASSLLCQCDRVRYGGYSPASTEISSDLATLRALVDLL